MNQRGRTGSRWGLGAPACLLASLALCPAAAAAQTWLVLPASAGDPTAPPASSHAAVEPLAAALSEHVDTLPVERAGAAFERRASSAPVQVHAADLEALARDAHKALYHVASGMPARASRDVERALSRADRVLVSLNREAEAAEQLLDTCLYLVRAHLQRQHRTRASAQALECRRLVPDLEPDATMHPPDVLELLAAVEASQGDTSGALRITSEPDGCAVFANGRPLGRAPLALTDLSPGEYRLQAECEQGRPGRVHVVQLGTDAVAVRIDTRLDAAVRTSPRLALHYPDPGELSEHGMNDAARLGATLGVDELVLLWPRARSADRPGAEPSSEGPPARWAAADVQQVEAVRVSVSDRQVRARVRFAVPVAAALAPSLSARVGAALRSGAFVDLGREPPVALSREVGREAGAVGGPAAADAGPGAARGDHAGRGSADPPAAAWAVGMVGAAGVAAGWGLWGYHLSLEARYRRALGRGEDGTSELEDLDAFEYIPLAVTAAGAAATALGALPWLLPPAEGPPPLAWVVGVAGLASLATGIVFSVQGAACDDGDAHGRCTDALATTRVGGMLVATSLPLLAVPLVYLVRGADADDITGRAKSVPRVAVSRDGAILMMGGRF